MIEIVKTEEYNLTNLLVTLLVNGKQLTLIIPKPEAEGHESEVAYHPDMTEPIGLNLVTIGHYL